MGNEEEKGCSEQPANCCLQHKEDQIAENKYFHRFLDTNSLTEMCV